MNKLSCGSIFLVLCTFIFLSGFGPGKPKVDRYQPTINFNHVKHLSELGLDCVFCHEEGPGRWPNMIGRKIPDMEVCGQCHSEVFDPIDSQGCFNCHTDKTYKIVRTGDHPDVRRIWEGMKFNHGAHENRGIACLDCHTKVNSSNTSKDNNYPGYAQSCKKCHGGHGTK